MEWLETALTVVCHTILERFNATPLSLQKVDIDLISAVKLYNSLVTFLLKGRGFKSQPLHCRVQLWTSCIHTLSSVSGVTTLWRYINGAYYKKLDFLTLTCETDLIKKKRMLSHMLKSRNTKKQRSALSDVSGSLTSPVHQTQN